MSFGSGHPLAYPTVVTIGVLAVCAAWVPFADSDQGAGLATVAVLVLGYSVFRFATALGYLTNGLTGATGVAKRVRQQHRLDSRSWLELSVDGRNLWLPVYFEPALLTMTETTATLDGRAPCVGELRVYPSGRVRSSEPPGRLIDNPSRPDPNAPGTLRISRRLLFDAQSAVAAPFAGLLWVYVAGGGLAAFLGATCVAAAAALWFAAIRGSDPS
ncbi:hypothetical protein [Nocardia arthritidis]|uniref:Uncharacterized protein n=1 Tax=Nocardia arthritidis TaxID=228602 RepID=A0A6G9Y4J7_9NOCA|nr:hypothetical protein F5544_00710 [Nocardia arthritidis]